MGIPIHKYGIDIKLKWFNTNLKPIVKHMLRSHIVVDQYW